MSHQLRLLRAMGLVTGARRGRGVIYSLYDNHVALLLDEAVYHIEHLGLGITDETPATGRLLHPRGTGRLRTGCDSSPESASRANV